MTPFLNGRKTLAGSALAAPAVASTGCLPGMVRPAPAGTHTPTVEVVKEGDKVVRLVVTCGCGERTEIECLYSA